MFFKLSWRTIIRCFFDIYLVKLPPCLLPRKPFMKIKLFAVGATIALSALTANAEAATWTVTTTGLIDQGSDSTGVFGVVGQDLAGFAFTQSITVSVDQAAWENRYNWPSFRLQSLFGSGPAFTDTVTINGQSVTFSALTAFDGLQTVAGGSDMVADEITSYQYGQTATGAMLRGNISVWSATRFVPDYSFDQIITSDISSPAFAAYSDFGISGAQTATFYSHRLTSLSVNVTAVPEPATYAMLLAGLGLTGVVARRRRRGQRSKVAPASVVMVMTSGARQAFLI